MDTALQTALRLGADYCDIRKGDITTEVVSSRNRRVEFVNTSEISGFGIRVLKDGLWGFAASDDFTLDEVEPTDATWDTKPEIDPFRVNVEDKTALLLEARIE